jgi:SPP1 family predicted phage head-tail adaptor
MADDLEVGELRHRVSYQTISTTLDSVNQPIQAWTTQGTFWCKVEPLTGMELMNARQLKATTGHKLIMRNVNSALQALTPPASIAPSGRFLFENSGRILGIDMVFRVNEQNQWLSIHCTELKAPQ